MTQYFLIGIPLAAALAAAAWPDNRTRPWLLPATGIVHTALSLWLLVSPPQVPAGAWLGFDPLARAILPAVSLLFLACSLYGVSYLRTRSERSNRVFVAGLLAAFGLMSLAHQARHLGLLWIATEAVTFASVPLIHFNGTPRAFEATWKYLLVGGTGIALSLLGSFCLGYASLQGGGAGDLTFAALSAQGVALSRPWVLIAWVLLLAGYGTKMGLAPMHTWKPDAYGEAPGMVGAMLAGGVTTVAFAAVLRVRAVIDAAGAGREAGITLMVIGLFSMVVAALFLLGTRDFKRMLAYSSVEHMGILIVGLGIGGPALYGTMLHVVTNGMTKGVLFLSAGNIHRAYASKSTDEVRGALRRLPLSGGLFLAGFLAITGSPPFGPFVSEFSILNGAFDAGQVVVAALFLVFLLVVFIGMGKTVLKVVQGRRPSVGPVDETYRDGFLTIAPVLALMAIVLLLGLYIPAPLNALVRDAVSYLETRP